MTLTGEVQRLVLAWERAELSSNEFFNQTMDCLRKLAPADRHAALEMLSTHANQDMRKTASDFRVLEDHEALSKNIDYIRQISPLRSGVRLELFGGYDYYSSGGKPVWLNGRECYKATFLGFAPGDKNSIPVGLVAFDDVVEIPGHRGRYGVLRTAYDLESFAWGQTEGVVEVHLTEVLPEDLTEIRLHRDSASAIETHATYRIDDTA